MKNISKFLIVSLTLALAFSVCSCTFVKETAREVKQVSDYTQKIVAVTQITNPEEVKEKADELIHPSCEFTFESIMEKLSEDSDLEGIDFEALLDQGYSIGNPSMPEIKFNDPSTGGNIYAVTLELTAGGEVFTVTLDILSDAAGIGIYDFDISK